MNRIQPTLVADDNRLYKKCVKNSIILKDM